MEIPILYEDENYLLINKPAGLMVHPDGKIRGEKASVADERTLVDWILEKYPDMQGVGEPFMPVSGDSAGETIDRPGIVHRLDRDTSGVMVIAKNPESFADLKEKFAAREIQKMYHAVIRGRMKEDDGIIDRPIGRSPVDFRQRSAGRGARGEMREAITRWSVLARGTNVTFVEAIPKTGRTHQIRVHFKSIDRPIVGDALYDKSHARAAAEYGINRVALHAHSLSFVGLDGKKISVTAPYPADFAALVEKVKTAQI